MEEVGAIFDGRSRIEDIRAGAHIKETGEETKVGGIKSDKREEEKLETV